MNTNALILGFLAAAGISAANADKIHRIGLDGMEGIPVPVTEIGKDGIDRIHKVEKPGFELFPCPKPSKGTIMVCPGGGYSILAINHEGRDIAKMLNGFGYDVAILLYRVSEGDSNASVFILG